MTFIWLLLLLYQHVSQVAAAVSSSTTYSNGDSTCPSRTANYLTHTLPQQCLTSSRTVTTTSNASATSNGAESEQVEFIAIESLSGVHSTKAQISSAEMSISEATSSETEQSSTSHTLAIIVTATPVSNQELGPALPEIIEEDSPLESGNFLSFEEWKKQNLQKAGQSEHVGRDANAETREARKRQINMQNSLDSLGDDVEIDLDFSGFVPGGPDKSYSHATESSTPGDEAASKMSNVVSSRKKDAGTTCKERFNYASFDCAASMLKTNPQAKNPGSILSENKDAYMLNECSAENKFIIVELCHDILVDTVVLANFEFFSSIFRTFRVSVSDRYPAKPDKWKNLGLFQARNSREVQAFLVEDPMIWARYLRIEFLTHYGSEFYCPVSLVRVHGTTMLEEYKHDMDTVAEDEEGDSEEAEAINEEERLVPEAIDQNMLEKERQQQEDMVYASQDQDQDRHFESPSDTAQPNMDEGQICFLSDVPANATFTRESMLFAPAFDVCLASEAPEVTQILPTPAKPTVSDGFTAPPSVVPTSTTSSTSTVIVDTPTMTDKHSARETQSSITQPTPVESATSTSSSVVSGQSTKNSTQITQSLRPTDSAMHTSVERAESQKQSSQNATSSEPSKSSASPSADKSKQPGQNSTSIGGTKVAPSSSSAERSKQSGSATQSAPASPTMQESFFKSVQKRLQMLESNSSLSLQYIEDQSRALRDAFKKVEQRQLSKTSIFLDHLNSTVLKELREFRQQYDQLWQSTVIELEMQREQYQRENQAMHARLGVLADELIFQKRMSILQMTLILICLGLVLFSRGVINNYLELPLVQSVLSKSPSTRWMNLSSDSPTNTRKLNRVQSVMQMGTKPNGILKRHRRIQSDDSNMTDNLDQAEIYSPPTPVSFDGYSDASHSVLEDGKAISDPEFDPETIERPSTSPPTLAMGTEQTTPTLNGESRFTSLGANMVNPSGSSDSLAPPPLSDPRSAPSSPSKHLKWKLPEHD